MLPLDVVLPGSSPKHQFSVPRHHEVSSVADWERIVFGLSALELVEHLHFIGDPTNFLGFSELVDYAKEMGFDILVDVSSFRIANPNVLSLDALDSIDSLVFSRKSAEMPFSKVCQTIEAVCENKPSMHFDVDEALFKQITSFGDIPSANISVSDKPIVAEFLLEADGSLVRRADGVRLGSLLTEKAEDVFARRWQVPRRVKGTLAREGFVFSETAEPTGCVATFA